MTNHTNSQTEFNAQCTEDSPLLGRHRALPHTTPQPRIMNWTRSTTTVANSASNCAPTPLPCKTMLVLCITILSEPISLSILFPFLYFMVKDFDFCPESDIGYYVGFIASAFSFAQLLTSMAWGTLSDRIGRRPVLLIGLVGNSLTMLAFGLSKSLSTAILSRFVCGLLNGNIGVAKSIVSEITDKSNRAHAFSLISLNIGIGMFLGPLLGGILANPADRYPFFQNSWLFVQYPYFLPCLVSSFISTLGFIGGYYFLPETRQVEFSDSECNLYSIESPDCLYQDCLDVSPDCVDPTDQSLPPCQQALVNMAITLSLLDQQMQLTRCQQQLIEQQAADLQNYEVEEALDSDHDTEVDQDSVHMDMIEETCSNPSSVIDSSNENDGIIDNPNPIAGSTVAPVPYDLDTDDEAYNDVQEITHLISNTQCETEVITIPEPIHRNYISTSSITASISYGLLAFQSIIFIDTFPLWAVARPGIGLGFHMNEIGIILSILGLFTLVSQLLVYPWLTKKTTPKVIFQSPIFVLVLVFILLPCISAFMTDSRWIWVVLTITMGLRSFSEQLMLTSIMLIINDSAGPGQLGKVNGIAQCIASLARAVGPAVGGIVWAWSTQNSLGFPFNHLFLFWLVISLLVLLGIQSWFISDDSN
ncbi:major facilitator superfamily domain-containing protein [Globomyces pollinis-pini]|nr:major facilitator superfamily domain-containing protein [Globomyces pollinis-pini]